MADAIELSAFSAEQAAAISGLSVRQLSYWDQSAFFRPELAGDGSRIYSFRDLVGLRTIAQLRGRVSLQRLRAVAPWLRKWSNTPWSRLRFFLAGKEIVFQDPGSEALISGSIRAQTVAALDLEEVARGVRDAVTSLRRESRRVGEVRRRRSVMRNRPVIAGTRVTVDSVRSLKEAGYTVERIVSEFPNLSERDVRAALRQVAGGRRRRASW